jgi:hypothetical protein
MPCADVAIDKAKPATAINLSIVLLLYHQTSAQLMLIVGPGLEIDQGPQGLRAGTFPASATSRAAFDSGEQL